MGSRPYINMSLLLIIASTGLLASSNTIQPEMTFDFPTCLEAIKGCFYQIHQFKIALVTGVQPATGLVGPACCAAVKDIHEMCWLFFFPDPFYTPELQNYCAHQFQVAPPAGPLDPDTPLAPVPAPQVDPSPASAPQVDPSPAPAPQAPSPAPQVDPSPAPAPQAPSPAPEVDPPAPAPQGPSPAPTPQAPSPASEIDPPAPAPQAPSSAPEVDPSPAPAPQVPSPSPAAPSPAPARRHCHRHRGSLGEKWYCT